LAAVSSPEPAGLEDSPRGVGHFTLAGAAIRRYRNSSRVRSLAHREPAAVKKIAILPALLTLGNGICGFVAITYASKIGMLTPGDGDAAHADEFNFVWAGWFILFA